MSLMLKSVFSNFEFPAAKSLDKQNLLILFMSQETDVLHQLFGEVHQSIMCLQTELQFELKMRRQN